MAAEIFGFYDLQSNLKQIIESEKQNELKKNVGQFLDISFSYELSRSSFRREKERQAVETIKINTLKSELLSFLKTKENTFNENDINDYFNSFKSPYHVSNALPDAVSQVRYTSEHLNRLLKKEQWLRKNNNAQYAGKVYTKKDSSEEYYVDTSHLGIDLGFGETGDNSTIYPTQTGNVRYLANQSGLGNVMLLQHSITKNGRTFNMPLVTVYAHLHSKIIKEDFANDVNIDIGIAKEGNTPKSGNYSEHLHLELWKVPDDFDLSVILNLSFRDKEKKDKLSFSYRHINTLFKSFIDHTGSDEFVEINSDNSTEPSYSDEITDVKLTGFTGNNFVNGTNINQNKKILGVADNSINIIKKDKQNYYDLSLVYASDDDAIRNIIAGEYSQKNQITPIQYSSEAQNASNIESESEFFSINFENKNIFTTDQKKLSINLDFKELINSRKNKILETQETIYWPDIFEKEAESPNMSIDEKKPLFTFYFPIRINIFRNNIPKDKLSIDTKKFNNLLARDLTTDSRYNNYYIRFKIFDIKFNDILKVSFDKINNEFLLTDEINKKEIIKSLYKDLLGSPGKASEYYEMDIVNILPGKVDDKDVSFVDVKKGNSLDVITKNTFQILDHVPLSKSDQYEKKYLDDMTLFNFSYDVKNNFCKINLFMSSESYKRITVVPLDIANSAHFESDFNNDDILANGNSKFFEANGKKYAANHSFSHFFELYKDVKKPNDANKENILNEDNKTTILKYLNNDISKSFRYFLKETYANESIEKEYVKEKLPDVVFSNVYDNNFYDSNDDNYSQQFVAAQLVSASNDTINSYNKFLGKDLPSTYYLFEKFIDNPYRHIENFPFVESQFFSHRIISNYLPDCIYENKFKKLEKKVAYAADPMSESIKFYDYNKPILKNQDNRKNPFEYSDDKYEFKVDAQKIMRSKSTTSGPTDRSSFLFKNSFAFSGFPSQLVSKVNDTDEEISLYTFHLNLNDLYFDIIFNMIKLEVFEIIPDTDT